MWIQKVIRQQRQHSSTNTPLARADLDEGLVVNLTLHKQIIELLVESGERGMTLNVSPSSLVRVILVIRSAGPLRCTRQS